MTIKDDLHKLVDRLDDEGAAEILAYLRQLLRENETSEARESRYSVQGMNPPAVSGSDFFDQAKLDLPTLAQQQGVRPIRHFDDLLGDFWPEDETADDFISAIREWRREGAHA